MAQSIDFSSGKRKVPDPHKVCPGYFSKSCELRPINAVVVYNFLAPPSGFGKMSVETGTLNGGPRSRIWVSVAFRQIAAVFLWDESWRKTCMGSCLPRYIRPLHRKEQGEGPVAIRDHRGGRGCL